MPLGLRDRLVRIVPIHRSCPCVAPADRRTPGRAGAARMNVRKGVPLEDGATCTSGGSDFDTTPISIPMPRQGHAEAPSTRSRSHVAADPSGAARSMGPFKRVGKGFGVPPAHRRDHPGKRGWPLRASHNRLDKQIFVHPACSPLGCGRLDPQGTTLSPGARLRPVAVAVTGTTQTSDRCNQVSGRYDPGHRS
jgi:hypothetical protein